MNMPSGSTKTERRSIKEWWSEQDDENIVLGAFAAIALALVLSVTALVFAWTHQGISRSEAKTEARVAIAKDLGFTYQNGNVVVIPDGPVDTYVKVTAKRQACELTARQAANFKLTELPLDQLLAACDSIK